MSINMSLSFGDVLLLLGFVFQLGVFWQSFRSLKSEVSKLSTKLESEVSKLRESLATKEDMGLLRDDVREIRGALFIPVREEAAARYRAGRDAKTHAKEDKHPKTKTKA